MTSGGFHAADSGMVVLFLTYVAFRVYCKHISVEVCVVLLSYHIIHTLLLSHLRQICWPSVWGILVVLWNSCRLSRSEFVTCVASYRDFIGAVVVLSVSCIYNVSMALLRERLACFKSCLSFVTQNSTCNAITNQALKVGSKFTTLCFAAQICNVLINCFFSGLLVCRHVYPTWCFACNIIDFECF